MDLSVITVTYQSKEYIDSAILSVVAATLHCSYEHIVVDNASTDETARFIEERYSNYVRLIKSKKNLGFAAANNLALAQAKGRYLLFLNPDCAIEQGRIDTLLSWLDQREEVGIVGCQLLSRDKMAHPALRPARFPTLGPYLPALLHLKPFFCTIHPSFSYPQFDDEQIQEVESLRGSFLLVRRELLEKLGFAFDPRYFLLFEDLDLCREAKKAGYKVVYHPALTCVDYFGRSFATQSRADKYVHMARSFLSYTKKWHPLYHQIWIALLLGIGFLLRIPEWGMKKSLRALGKRDGS